MMAFKPVCPYCSKGLKDYEFHDNDGTMELFAYCRSCNVDISVTRNEDEEDS